MVSAVGIDIDQLVDNYPRLFHMATAGSWPAIQQHGLLPTTHIVATAGLPEPRQAELLRQRRRQSTDLDHPLLGKVTIRDQAPLREPFFSEVLTDLSAQEWLDVLNERVFFWLHPTKLARLLNARRYRAHEQDVLTVDTRSLVEAHEANIRLSPMNSGATLYPSAPKRGANTFRPLADYPFAERRRTKSVAEAITELAVIGGVTDLGDHVLTVERYRGATRLAQTYP
jgi:hypothetical protein